MPSTWQRRWPSSITRPSSSLWTASGSWACERGCDRAVCAQPQRAAASGQSGLQPAGLAECQEHQGGKIVLRIEDLDAERCPRKYADALEEDLSWLGLVWDEGGSSGGPNGPYYQSECAAIYTESYNKLEAQGLVYPCFCSRAQLHAASAPHTSDGNVIYPGTCRGPDGGADRRKAQKEGSGLPSHGAR